MSERQYVIDDFSIKESWRIFKIIAEFVEGFETLSEVYPGVSVFGSASITERDPVYALGRQVGRLLVENGFSVITGGGPGVMEAVNRGAAEANGKSVGLCIQLPKEQAANTVCKYSRQFSLLFYKKSHVCKIRR